MTAKKAAANKPATPQTDVKLDGEAALAILAGIVNAALESTAGVASGSTGTVQQEAASSTSTETSHKAQTDVNSEEAISTYNQLAAGSNQAHIHRVNNMSEQILQNAITQANALVTNANDTANLVNKQAVAHRDVAIDRVWNIDEQVAAAAMLYGRIAATLNNPIPAA